jgi:hypothetical protein
MYAENVKIKLKPWHGFENTALAKALRSFIHLGISEAWTATHALQKGDTVEIPTGAFKITNAEAEDPNFWMGWFEFIITLPPNPYLEQAAKWKMQRELLEKGAAGDTEAAIKYCQMELAGEISHGAMG